MFKNFEICPHCEARGFVGRPWVLGPDTPTINRSDGARFHLQLFSGPESVRGPSGEIVAERLLCDFRWVHDAISGGTPIISLLTLTNPGESRGGVLEQIEKAADLMAETLQRESWLAPDYDFDGSVLKPIA